MQTLLELLALTVEYLDAAERDAGVTKQDLAEALRNRLCVITGKVVAQPVVSNFAMPPAARGSPEEVARGVEEFFES